MAAFVPTEAPQKVTVTTAGVNTPVGVSPTSPTGTVPGTVKGGGKGSGAGVGGVVVALGAVDAGSVGILSRRPNHQCVSRQRHRRAEQVKLPCVGGLEIGLLDPIRPVAHEHIGRARVKREARVAPDAVHAGGIAVLEVRPDDHGVARNRY